MVWAPMALLWLLLGSWCAQIEPHPAPDQPLLALSDGLLRSVEGTITSAGPVRGEIQQSVDEPPPTRRHRPSISASPPSKSLMTSQIRKHR